MKNNLIAFVLDQFHQAIDDKQKTVIVNVTEVSRSQPSIRVQNLISCFLVTNITYTTIRTTNKKALG